MRDENEIFEDYRTATSDRKTALERELAAALSKHASSIVWTLMRNKCPDIVNEMVGKGIASSKTFRGDSKFSTYFERMVRNRCLTELRKPKREVSIESLTPSQLGQLCTSPQEAASRLEIEMLADRLNNEDRTLLLLKREGYSSDEIGKTLGITPNNVNVQFNSLCNRIRSGKALSKRNTLDNENKFALVHRLAKRVRRLPVEDQQPALKQISRAVVANDATLLERQDVSRYYTISIREPIIAASEQEDEFLRIEQLRESLAHLGVEVISVHATA